MASCLSVSIISQEFCLKAQRMQLVYSFLFHLSSSVLLENLGIFKIKCTGTPLEHCHSTLKLHGTSAIVYFLNVLFNY